MYTTVNQAANELFETLLDDSKGDFFNTKRKFSKILDEFEAGIRQDQKAKDCVLVRGCFFNEENAIIVTKTIMESEQ